MIASGTLTTIAMNLSSNKMNNEITIDSNKNNKVLDENIDSLEQIVGDTGIYAAAATVVNITLNISSLVLNKIDKGNGIVIRFFAWVIPKKIAGADYKW